MSCKGDPVLKRVLTIWMALMCWLAQPAVAEPDHAVAAHYPPLMIAGNPERPGSSVEILLEAARRAGREVRLEFLPFRRALKTVQHGRNVLQPSLFRRPEREPLYTWVVQTNVVQNTFNTVGAPIDTLEQGRDLTWVGVEHSSALDLLLTGAGYDNLSRVDRPEINAQKLMNGRIDAWALPHLVAVDIWKRQGFDVPLIGGASLMAEQNYIIASPDTDAAVLAAYRAAVEDMREDGTLQAILEKYGWPVDR